jgi:2-oxoglutarate dehydrogenase complex dehydrogenase (E1) component-like enzyme
MKPVADIYEAQLIAEGILTPEKANELKSRCKDELERAY